jgi:5-methyltetrahydropteroyltriglutamate--homocysteine methyltransferase
VRTVNAAVGGRSDAVEGCGAASSQQRGKTSPRATSGRRSGAVWDAGVVPVDARVEHVGSLLRPHFLRGAREAYALGELTPAQLKATEDRAVNEVVAMQERVNLPVVNDGEMRRESFQSELTAACDGFTGVDVNAWLWGQWHSPEVGDVTIDRPEGLAVVAPLHKRRNLATEEFTFLRGCTRRQTKVTLPSPSLFANLWSQQTSTGAYPTLDAFLADVVTGAV